MFHNKTSYFSRKTKWTAKINYFLKFIKIIGFIKKHWMQKCQDNTKIVKMKQVKKISWCGIKIQAPKDMKMSFKNVKINRYVIGYLTST